MTVTHWILLGVSLALITFNIVVAVTDVAPTLSEVVWSLTRKHNLVFIAFAFGLLMGHWFWR